MEYGTDIYGERTTILKITIVQ